AFYLPSVLAVFVGKQAGLPVFDTLYLCRLFTAFCSILTAAAAIAFAQRGQALLFLCLSLPMALTLFASCSQDGPMIASAALAIALLPRSKVEMPLSRSGFVAVGLLLGLVVAARPVYAPLLGLMLLPLADRYRRFREIRYGLLAVGLALGISIL